MNLMKKPKIDDVKFKRMKSINRDSVQFDCEVTVTDDGSVYNLDRKGNYPIIPHHDMTIILEDLKLIFGRYFNAGMIESFVLRDAFNATPAQKKYAQKALSEMLCDYQVNGIAWTGKNRDKIIIMGTINGCAVNTKGITFDHPDFGEELEQLTKQLNQELYEYVFVGKRAQLELGLGDEDEVVDGKTASANDG